LYKVKEGVKTSFWCSSEEIVCRLEAV